MHLLFVCTGNLCRSPFAERRAAGLLDRPDIGMGSAGTRAPVGSPMDEATAAVLVEYGGSPEGHVARRLTPGLVAEAHLVLTMTVAHRTAVLHSAPGALRRTFTLSEAAALISAVDPADDPSGLSVDEHVISMVSRLAEVRATLPRPHPGFPDVADPIGRPLEVHREVAAVIDGALHTLLPRLVPA